MFLILNMLLDYLNENHELDKTVLLTYKKKLEEEQEDKIKKMQAYKKMIKSLDSLLKLNIKTENDISNLKNDVQELSIVVMYSRCNETDHGTTISDFLQEYSKSHTALSQN